MADHRWKVAEKELTHRFDLCKFLSKPRRSSLPRRRSSARSAPFARSISKRGRGDDRGGLSVGEQVIVYPSDAVKEG
ncbi:MAG: hypothetical protein MPW14_00995 [Candidatus Manganitrophus sp.]|nr:MAG: hypothetical protein MPW14_00995 [Candidatus Manganitrophus sp.]